MSAAAQKRPATTASPACPARHRQALSAARASLATRMRVAKNARGCASSAYS
jgi:hypothetical protein